MSKVFGFVFTMGTLLLIGSGINWQGTGNMSEDNLTQVRSYINANFSLTWAKSTLTASNDPTLANFATGLSENLNSLWDRAWNVVVVYITDGSNADTVLYGYAFRDHWMWINGFVMNDGFYVSFVIWKDYNCIKWWTLDSNIDNGDYLSSYTDSTPILTVVQSYQNNLNWNDVWSGAKTYGNTLTYNTMVKIALGSDLAFSVVMTQSKGSNLYARFCAKNWFLNNDRVSSKIGTGTGLWGKALILQMR